MQRTVPRTISLAFRCAAAITSMHVPYIALAGFAGICMAMLLQILLWFASPSIGRNIVSPKSVGVDPVRRAVWLEYSQIGGNVVECYPHAITGRRLRGYGQNALDYIDIPQNVSIGSLFKLPPPPTTKLSKIYSNFQGHINPIDSQHIDTALITIRASGLPMRCLVRENEVKFDSNGDLPRGVERQILHWGASGDALSPNQIVALPLALNIFAGGTVAIIILLAYFYVVAVVRYFVGKCAVCGYAIVELERCPECGINLAKA